MDLISTAGRMEDTDDDVPLILTWDDANSGLLSEETERGDESKFLLTSPFYCVGS